MADAFEPAHTTPARAFNPKSGPAWLPVIASRFMELAQIVRDFAAAMQAVDHRRPQSVSSRDATRLYQPGIGPFAEDAAVAMTVAEMQAHDTEYARSRSAAILQAVRRAILLSGNCPAGPSK